MPKRLLELFSGTGSVGDVARELGFEVTSLDRDMPATFNVDIMDWEPEIYRRGYFDVIWASPPCTEYSRAKTTGIRDIEGANKVVLKTIEIMEYFRPKYWIIENPQTGLLKNQSFMDGIPFDNIDYCKYGMPYRKRTTLWNNIPNWEPRPLCCKDCGQMEGNRHKETAQKLPPGKKADWGDRAHHRTEDLYRVPAELINKIFLSMEW